MSTLSAEELELLGEMPPEDEQPGTLAVAQNLPSPASLPRSGSVSVYDAIVFDIETGPLPAADLWKVVPPFDPSTLIPFPSFDESSVKVGNLKDAAKIAEKIEQARAQHAVDAMNHAKDNLAVEGLYVAEVMNKAALSAITGRVLAIGYYDTNDEAFEVDALHPDEVTEAALIIRFWSYVEAAPEHCRIVGHNIAGFDLPFLIQRSWILGIEVPRGVIEGRFFARKFADTMQVWACGKVGNGSMAKLDDLAKVFGVGSKTGNGAMFAELFEKDRAAAIEYLKNDVAITYAVAKRMGVCK